MILRFVRSSTVYIKFRKKGEVQEGEKTLFK